MPTLFPPFKLTSSFSSLKPSKYSNPYCGDLLCSVPWVGPQGQGRLQGLQASHRQHPKPEHRKCLPWPCVKSGSHFWKPLLPLPPVHPLPSLRPLLSLHPLPSLRPLPPPHQQVLFRPRWPELCHLPRCSPSRQGGQHFYWSNWGPEQMQTSHSPPAITASHRGCGREPGGPGGAVAVPCPAVGSLPRILASSQGRLNSSEKQG